LKVISSSLCTIIGSFKTALVKDLFDVMTHDWITTSSQRGLKVEGVCVD